MKKFTVLVMTILVMTLLLTGCNSKKTSENPQVSSNTEHPKVQIEMQDGSKMVLELYPEFAPETVENFVNLSKSGFYDGLKFHRIVEGFMIQGGDPNGNGTGGSGKHIKGEFAENGFSQNTLKHTKGIISMARSSDLNSASSQFFIMDGEVSSLDGKYAAFGKLIEGEETLAEVASTPVEQNPHSGEVSLPKEDVVIKKVTVLDSDKK
jgi:peptidylprolyl isomerase/peptidyl-prolyl cis-trans isomerase B (cyclophilin B)